MEITRRNMILLLASAATAAGPHRWVNAQQTDDQATEDAYIYLLGRALVVRQEEMDRKAKGFAYNKIKYNPLGSADFANPNFDVAYLEAWIAVDAETPAILEIPKIDGRYYTAQILDEWGEVIVNINERSFPSKPYGTFALVAPGSKVKTPRDAGRVELHSNKAKLLGRVELKGDPEGAVALQKAFRLRSLGEPRISVPPVLPAFDNQTLIGVELFENVDQLLAGVLDVSPVAAKMQQAARAVAHDLSTSKNRRSAVDQLIKDKIVPTFKEFVFTRATTYKNHWTIGNTAGNYGANYGARSSANYAGIWANAPSEAVYLAATKDADEKPLDGANGYVLHFPADALPDEAVNSYWSVILVGVPDYRVVANELKRYNFNSYSKLTPEADGSLKIGIGSKPPPGIPETNWLPAPDGKPFSLTFRCYVPKQKVIDGEWTPPAVARI